MRSIHAPAMRPLHAPTISTPRPRPRPRFHPRHPTPCTSRAQPHLTHQRLQTQSSAPPRAEPAEQSTATQHPQTHYTFFPKSLPRGPPPGSPFAIDLSALKREFLQLQARAHPDLHPPAEKKRFEALSARINEAYKTLQNPLARAQYLLSLRGVEVSEEEGAKGEDNELLMEVLEARERIEEVRGEEELRGLREENEERIRRSEEVLERAFGEDDVGLARGESVRLRYWVGIKESIDGWERGEGEEVLRH